MITNPTPLVDCGECRTQGCPAGKCRNAPPPAVQPAPATATATATATPKQAKPIGYIYRTTGVSGIFCAGECPAGWPGAFPVFGAQQAQDPDELTPRAAKRRVAVLTSALMEQAQVFASAWSLIYEPFDAGGGLESANAAKAELQQMLVAALTARGVNGALDALRELRQRIEGYVPFEQAAYIGSLFDAVRDELSSAPAPAEDAVHGACAAWLRNFVFLHKRDPTIQEVWDATAALCQQDASPGS